MKISCSFNTEFLFHIKNNFSSLHKREIEQQTNKTFCPAPSL